MLQNNAQTELESNCDEQHHIQVIRVSIYPRGMRCGPLKLLYWPKINRKREFSRLRETQWVLSNDPNNSARGLTKFRLYLGKRYKPFNSLGLNPTENIMHKMHKSSIKRELPSSAVNSEIYRPGVTLHFFRFLGDFEKDLPNRMRHYIIY